MLTKRQRPLAHDLAEVLEQRISTGALPPGARMPTEAQFMEEFGVSRTVVREALSKLQQSGTVQTRHGVGTFVVGPVERGQAFQIAAHHLATLRDVIALLELRIGIETEAAALAAARREDHHLRAMRAALDDFERAVVEGQDAVEPDLRFHREIALATGNPHFTGLMNTLGGGIIPRARLGAHEPARADRSAYLRRVNTEHESIFDALVARDADAARAAMRTHLVNSRERRRRIDGAARISSAAASTLYDDWR